MTKAKNLPWITVNFIPATRSKTAYYVTLFGSVHDEEHIRSATVEVITETVRGVAVQHQFYDDLPHPVNSRIVPVVPGDNDNGELIPAEDLVECDDWMTFLGIWPKDTAEEPDQITIDMEVECLRNGLLQKLAARKAAGAR